MSEREKRMKGIKTAVTVLVVLLAIIAVVSVWRYALTGGDKSDGKDTAISETTDTPDNSDTAVDNPPSSSTDPNPGSNSTSTPDPASFSSIVIAPIGVEVFYSKGTQGFQYAVLKTDSGTQYVEFSTESLVGTRCTDDRGAFASIVKNPSSSESQTTTVSTKIGNDTYGLSLASDTCTNDADLLAEYQAAFKAGFGSLRAVPEED